MLHKDGRGPSAFLQLRGIRKSFSGTVVLRDVDLDARPGEVHAVVGENGAGKSTLMKIAAGVYQPDAGTIVVGDTPGLFRRPVDAINRGIAMIFQELNLAPHLTVAENIFLGREPRKTPGVLDRKAAKKAAQKLIAENGFDLAADEEVRRLSAAQKQIVEILKALAARSRLLIMDEPTSSLSEAESERLMGIIRALRQKGVAVIYVSHRLEEVKAVADRITVLRDGEKVTEGASSDLDIATLVRHMVGREIRDFYPRRQVKPGRVALAVENLSRRNEFESVSLEVREGEVAGIAGLVGAGRTELAEAIFGARPAESGLISIGGRPVIIRSPCDAIAAGIGLLTEDRKRNGLCLHLPLSWNISLANLSALTRWGVLRRRDEEKVAARYIDRLRIHGGRPGRVARFLSGGNQQKVVLARWLYRDSRVLIFDEPTRGIDVGAKRDVYGLINELAESGKAILMISSELPELLGMCDVIFVMHRGRLVARLEGGKTTAEEVMHYAAVGRKNE